MAFTLQDDTGAVANANAYIDESFFDDYHTDRANDFSASDTAAKQAAIIKASDYVDSRFLANFPGTKLADGQTTEWPRENATDSEGEEIEGIPEALKEAIAEYAFIALSATLAPNPTYSDTGTAVKRVKEKVGPLEEETEYMETKTVSRLRSYPVADMKLRSILTASKSGGRVIR